MSTAFHMSRSALFLFRLFHIILNLKQGNKFFHDFNFLFIEKYFTLASSIYKIIPSRQDAKKCYPVQSMKMSPPAGYASGSWQTA